MFVGASYDIDQVAEELADCRQRGLDWLDRRTTNQSPVPAAAIQQLAEAYVARTGIAATGRVAQIKILLRDAIQELARQGQSSDADLLRDLFFGKTFDGPIESPGALLRRARDRQGDSTDSRFRERRAHLMGSFAQFLIMFAGPPPTDDLGETDDVAPPKDQHPALAGYARDNEHFIQLLAQASSVTIVGITNEQLVPMLEEALRRKRVAVGQDATWDSMRIVFLAETLLGVVNDERELIGDPVEALRLRRQEAAWARRSVWGFLKLTEPMQWSIHDYPYLPAVAGALLEFGNRNKIAHLLIRHPQAPAGGRLYVEVEDVADRFSWIFDDIVRHSDQSNMVVPVGFPAGQAFQYTTPRLQIRVLKDKSGAWGWLPMVLVVTPRRGGNRTEALLQLRTAGNSSRELNCISHLTGHVLQDDRLRPAGLALPVPPTSFGLEDPTPLSAARRVVQEVTGDDLAAAMRPALTGRYLYPDKEHLFFFVFVLDLPEGIQFPRRAEMHSYPLDELLAIRARAVLQNAALLCRTTTVTGQTWSAAAEIVALNLVLHDRADLGDELKSQAGRADDTLTRMAASLDRLANARTSPSLASPGREVLITGMAGFQHREFFSALLPLYAQLGISGASDLLDAIKVDRRKSDAIRELAGRYEDEDLLASLPLEL